MAERRRILVCGSRGWTDAPTMRKRLSQQDVLSAIVIQGGARGADLIAKNICRDNNVHTAQVDPIYGKSKWRGAPMLRNLAMLDLQPDLVIAFSEGTHGTQFTINEARKRGIPVEVIGRETAVSEARRAEAPNEVRTSESENDAQQRLTPPNQTPTEDGDSA